MPEHTPTPSPHRAVYGFAFYLLFFTLFIIYELWALLPTEQLGLDYLPDKYFAVCLPMLVLMGMFFFEFFIYPALNLTLTADVDELASVADVALMQRRMRQQQQPGEELSWALLKCPTQTQKAKEIPVIEHCAHCPGTHQPPSLKPVPPLDFLDLQDVNRSLFEGMPLNG